MAVMGKEGRNNNFPPFLSFLSIPFTSLHLLFVILLSCVDFEPEKEICI
jgi:hypothetical protein